MTFKENFVKNPTVAFIIIVIAIFSIEFMLFHFTYSNRIDNYKEKINNQREKIDELDRENEQLVFSLKSDKTESINASISGKSIDQAEETFGNVKLELKKNIEQYFWGNQAKITLEYTYPALKSINCVGYYGDTKFDYDIKIGERKVFFFNVDRFYMDVLKISEDEAVISITKKK